jgi:transcriptional regulator with XRE-family HTH domain
MDAPAWEQPDLPPRFVGAGGGVGALFRTRFIYYHNRMDAMVDDTGARIARRVRLERDARGWSLADLAAHAGVSKAAISKIEREEMSPTAASLVRLANAFGLTLAGLLLRAEAEGSRLSRVGEQSVWRDPETGYLRRQIFSRPDHPLELARIELPPRQRVAFPASSYAHIRQAMWVLAGELAIVEGGACHRLHPGDCLGFGPPGDVTLENPGADPCTYLVALSRS